MESFLTRARPMAIIPCPTWESLLNNQLGFVWGDFLLCSMGFITMFHHHLREELWNFCQPPSSQIQDSMESGTNLHQPLVLWKKHRSSMESGQIIATSHDLTPKCSLVREIPLFQGNLGWWNIMIWPVWSATACLYGCFWFVAFFRDGWQFFNLKTHDLFWKRLKKWTSSRGFLFRKGRVWDMGKRCKHEQGNADKSSIIDEDSGGIMRQSGILNTESRRCFLMKLYQE